MFEDFGTDLPRHPLRCNVCKRIFSRNFLQSFTILDKKGVHNGRVVYYCRECYDDSMTYAPELFDGKYIRLE